MWTPSKEQMIESQNNLHHLINNKQCLKDILLPMAKASTSATLKGLVCQRESLLKTKSVDYKVLPK
ncbi:hypothetical protein HanIR_Chr16g0812691 [Helianthus annuus]|nr:hypothetical protein HanIR_Chr16g0812691 [Helianthus annuus]